jgi:hypothetical protein
MLLDLSIGKCDVHIPGQTATNKDDTETRVGLGLLLYKLGFAG